MIHSHENCPFASVVTESERAGLNGLIASLKETTLAHIDVAADLNRLVADDPLLRLAHETETDTVNELTMQNAARVQELVELNDTLNRPCELLSCQPGVCKKMGAVATALRIIKDAGH